MKPSAGHLIDIGDRPVRLPAGWSVTQFGGVTLCGRHDLKQRVALFQADVRPPEDDAIDREQLPTSETAFSVILEEGAVNPSPIERLLFADRPYHRFEWLVERKDFRLFAVYLSEPEDDRSLIKARVEELLSALRVEE